ncbi:MAG TPA: dienelactone hydrolase family protein [Ardenticatenaceae bacterium]|nr:dienelactone hydrolase family protein [Ardenticatenaceae bacterium]
MDRVYVMELVRSFQVGELSRREFVARATLALGSMATVNVLLAACAPGSGERPPVVDTQASPAAPGLSDEDDLTVGIVEYPDVDGETLTGYFVRPTDRGAVPAVVVIQEWWGVDDHIKDVARRLAREGFITLAPDLYHGAVTTEPDEARKLVMALDMQEAVREIRQAIAFLQTLSSRSTPEIGIVGFCMGGGLALETARVQEGLGAVVAFYGSPLASSEAAEVKAPLLGLYGAEDRGIPEQRVRAMEAALDEAGIENEMHIYAGAGHSFFNDTRASSYHAEASADAWQRTLAWFRAHLGSE